MIYYSFVVFGQFLHFLYIRIFKIKFVAIKNDKVGNIYI